MSERHENDFIPHDTFQILVSIATIIGKTGLYALLAVIGDSSVAQSIFTWLVFSATLCLAVSLSHAHRAAPLSASVALCLLPLALPPELFLARYILASSGVLIVLRMIELILNQTIFFKWSTHSRIAMFLTFGDLRRSAGHLTAPRAPLLIKCVSNIGRLMLVAACFAMLMYFSEFHLITASEWYFFALRYAVRWFCGFAIMYEMLGVLSHANEIVFILRGLQTLPQPDSPLQTSSIQEAWSSRWNLSVQFVLKKAVYEPVLKAYGSRWLAVIVTFLASAILHVYPTYVAGISPGCLLSQTIFFVLQVPLIFIERALQIKKRSRIVQKIWVYGALIFLSPLVVEPFCQIMGF